jgi:hypothetical protein
VRAGLYSYFNNCLLPRQGSSSPLRGGEEHLFFFCELSLAKEKVHFVLMVIIVTTNAQVTLRQNLNSLLFCDHDKDKNKTKKQQ